LLNVGKKTDQLPKWNAGQYDLYGKANVLRQIGICNKVASGSLVGRMAGLINKWLKNKRGI
jgi:hypothetical protein